MDLGLLAALRAPDGQRALAAAAEATGGDPIRAADALRRLGFAPELAAAALTQAELRSRAYAKFGADAAVMWFTRAGLEQATRSAVAGRRAQRLRAAGVHRLLDLGCGLGSDAIAVARAGIRVTAVDADPLTAGLAAANAEALGLAAAVSVRHGRAEEQDLTGAEAVFCDPARRRAGGRVFDPDAYAPPWSFVAALPAAVPYTVLKLAPGFPHERLPPGAEAEWVSIGGELVETAAWCGPLAGVAHRATVLHNGSVAELTGTGDRIAAVGPVGAVLYDPDPAVVRGHLVAEFADTVGGTLADPSIAYVYADAAKPTPFARAYRVDEVLPFSLKRLRAALRERGVGRLTVKKRGSALVPEELRRQLRPAGPNEATVVLTRVAGRPTAVICQAILS